MGSMLTRNFCEEKVKHEHATSTKYREVIAITLQLQNLTQLFFPHEEP